MFKRYLITALHFSPENQRWRLLLQAAKLELFNNDNYELAKYIIEFTLNHTT